MITIYDIHKINHLPIQIFFRNKNVEFRKKRRYKQRNKQSNEQKTMNYFNDCSTCFAIMKQQRYNTIEHQKPINVAVNVHLEKPLIFS